MKIIVVFLLFIFNVSTLYSKSFSDRFIDKTMRFDYYHCGNSEQEYFFFDKIVKEPYWAGSKVSLIDEKEYGNHFFVIKDKDSDEVIYSRGYGSLFNEWQYTSEARECDKGYKESIIFPFPKEDVILEIYTRNSATGKFEKKFSKDINPLSYQILSHQSKGMVFDIEINGEISKTIDLVLLSEGYRTDEKDKFIADSKKFAESLWAYSPFKEERKNFNVRAVWCGDGFGSGVSVPKDDLWVNTPLGAKFYTFDSERYQMVDDLQIVRDYAANAPYDYIYILTNSEKYGGGGIYNFYGISSVNHESLTAEVYVHEFGHLFVGLADEYDGNSEAMHNSKIEPWEENITSLVNLEQKDWSKMIADGVKVPTEVSVENENVVGVYEGAAYVKKGLYRPWINCIMRSLKDTKFCPVCQNALKKQIHTHIK